MQNQVKVISKFINDEFAIWIPYLATQITKG